ncbi:MAG: nucleoporin Nup120/160-domain-containing protein [Linnemannia gamsii]|nr:MAG: nucleoporin Nup120/160-domain-containing protein [Linnemannia gamsii]
MAPIAPMWWFKEVPVQPQAFVDASHSIIHTVPRRQTIPTYPYTPKDDPRHFQNQAGVFVAPHQPEKSVVWRTRENATVLELISLSGKENVPTRQISFRFHAPILPGIHFAPLTQQGGISIALLTADSVLYRLHLTALSHFLDRDTPPGYSTCAQIKWTNGGEPTLFKYLGSRAAAVASSNGTLYFVKTALLSDDMHRHENADINVYDLHDDSHLLSRIQHASTFHKLYNRVQSTLERSVPAGFPETKARMDIVAMEAHSTHDDTFLFALYQDRTIRVWSMNRRQCLQVIRTPTSLNDVGYVQETIDSTFKSHLKVLFNPAMSGIIRLLAYIPSDTDSQLSIYTAQIDPAGSMEFVPGSLNTLRSESAAGPGGNGSNLISLEAILDDSQSGYTIWGLWQGDMRISVKYMHIHDPATEREQFDAVAQRELLDGRWWSVAMQAPLSGFIKSMSSFVDSDEDYSAFFADYAFASGRFSDRTILLALNTIFKDRTFTLDSDIQQQIKAALTVRTPGERSQAVQVKDREDEIMAWTKFISTCGKIDHEASAPLGLTISPSTGYMVVVKQDTMSFLSACDESEVLYHTFQDKQFEVSQFISTPPSQLRNTYAKLQDLSLRQDIAKVFMAMEVLTRNFNAKTSKNVEKTIAQLTATSGPRNFIDVFGQEYLPHYIAKAEMNRARNFVGSCNAHQDVFQFLIQQFLDNVDVIPSGMLSSRCILPFEALVSASLQQLAAHRYEIAQQLLVLIAVLMTASPSSRTWILDETQLITDSMKLTQSLRVLKWVSGQALANATSPVSGLENQLSQLNVQEKSQGAVSSTTGARQSLTGTLMKTISYGQGVYGQVELPLHLAIPRAVSKLMYHLGLLNRDGAGDDGSRHFAVLAQRLSGLKEMGLLTRFLEIVPSSSSLSYYRGKVFLHQGQPAEALRHFLAVTTSFGNDINNVEQELDIMQLDYNTRIHQGQARLEDYYAHIITLLSEHNAHEQVMTVARLSVLDLLKNPNVQVSETHLRAPMKHMFTSALALGLYERAYQTVMQMTNETVRKQHLKELVSTMCEKGDGAQLSLFPFPGLHEDVERMLVLKAQQTPILSLPNYYRPLFAYHTYRGDHKKAATHMYEYARRLLSASHHTESAKQLLTEASETYLTAINSLHLTGPDSAWVTISNTGYGPDEVSKRRRLSTLSTASSTRPAGFSGREQAESINKVTVVSLSDMKKEYAMVVAKLKLVREIPEHVAPVALTLTPRETQSMLLRRGYYDMATSLALLYQLDLDIVFNFLVDCYLTALSAEQNELSQDWSRVANRTTVDRTKSATALITLQQYLEKHDRPATNYKHRLEVVSRILQRNPDFDLQPWMTQHYLAHNPEDLIRLYLKFDALDAAARFSSTVIQTALNKEEAVSRHSNARWLPYTLLDEIFAQLTEQIRECEEHVQNNRPARSVNGEQDWEAGARLKELKELKKQLDTDVRLYMESVERESIFGGKR